LTVSKPSTSCFLAQPTWHGQRPNVNQLKESRSRVPVRNGDIAKKSLMLEVQVVKPVQSAASRRIQRLKSLNEGHQPSCQRAARRHGTARDEQRVRPSYQAAGGCQLWRFEFLVATHSWPGPIPQASPVGYHVGRGSRLDSSPPASCPDRIESLNR
jgi:hypothetical protein